MNLQDVLKPYPFFSVALESDNASILDFFNSITMDTKEFSVRYDRGSNFFSFSNDQSDRTVTFIIKDEKGLIKGTAVIVIVDHFIDGKFETCAYLGDLRISPLLSAKIRIHWKKCYGEIITHFSSLDEFKGIRYLYSAILDDNQNAMRSLLKNNDQIIYHELQNYETISVYRKNFFSKINHRFFRLCKPTEKELRDFLNQSTHTPGMSYGFRCPAQEIDRRTNQWSDFGIENFLVIKNKHGDIVATTAPWICKSKKLIVERMGRFHTILGKLFPLLGIPKLQIKHPIEVLYLTHLVFAQNISKEERALAISIFLDHLLKQKNRTFHIVSFFHYPEWEVTYQLPFFFEKTKAKFYQVMSKEQYEKKEFLDLKNSPPAFEIGIA